MVMCGENDDPMIPVYWFGNDGLAGPCHDSIEGLVDDVRTELEAWIDNGFAISEPTTLTVTTGKMRRSEYDALPEFEGY